MPSVVSNLQAARSLPHRRYNEAQLIIANGKRGTGKTFFLNQYSEIREPRILALDPFNDFRGLTLAESAESALVAMSQGGPCRRRIIPPYGRDSREFAERFFSDCIDGEFPLRNSLLMLDEITLWSTANANKTLETLVLQGRRLGLRMCIGCQRISLIPGVLLAECTEMVLFHVTRVRDLFVVEQWTDGETREIVRNLEDRRCVVVYL